MSDGLKDFYVLYFFLSFLPLLVSQRPRSGHPSNVCQRFSSRWSLIIYTDSSPTHPLIFAEIKKNAKIGLNVRHRSSSSRLRLEMQRGTFWVLCRSRLHTWTPSRHCL